VRRQTCRKCFSKWTFASCERCVGPVLSEAGEVSRRVEDFASASMSKRALILEKRTSKNRRVIDGGASREYKADDRRLTCVIALMSARTGDPAAEKQPARRTVKKRVTGTGDVKAMGFQTVAVAQDAYAAHGRGRVPQFALLPAARNSLGKGENHHHRQLVLGGGAQFVQLVQRRPRAGTLGMRKDDEGGPVLRQRDGGALWEIGDGGGRRNGGKLLTFQNREACPNQKNPNDAQREQGNPNPTTFRRGTDTFSGHHLISTNTVGNARWAPDGAVRAKMSPIALHGTGKKIKKTFIRSAARRVY